MSALEFENSSSNPSPTDKKSTFPPRHGGQPSGSQLAKLETGSRMVIQVTPVPPVFAPLENKACQYRAHLSPQTTQQSKVIWNLPRESGEGGLGT